MFAPMQSLNGVLVNASRPLQAIRTAEIVELGLLADVKEDQRREPLAIAREFDERGEKKETANSLKLAGLTLALTVEFLPR